MRAFAGRVSQVQDLPDMFSDIGPPRQDSRRSKGELVALETVGAIEVRNRQTQEEPTWEDKKMWSDPVADMLTRIRNAVRVRKRRVTIPASKLKVGVAQVLKSEGYIEDFDLVEDDKQGVLRIDLKYGPRGEDLIHNIRRVSRPGCRKYSNVDDLPDVLDGLGIAIVSTSAGVLSDRVCRQKRVGGELICTVY